MQRKKIGMKRAGTITNMMIVNVSSIGVRSYINLLLKQYNVQTMKRIMTLKIGRILK